MLSIRSTVLNVRDLRRGAEFWSAALGYEPSWDTAEDDWVSLLPPGGGPRLSLQLGDQAPPEVPHSHLDLEPDPATGRDAEVERLLALGATRVDWAYDEGDDWVVLADPDGNRFCVVPPGG